MIGLSDIISALNYLESKLAGAEEFADAYANADFELLGRALETVHFSDVGVLSVLRALASGDAVSAELRERIFRFNQAAPEVQSALNRILTARADREKMTLADREALLRIGDIKTGIRWDISQVANHAVNMGEPFDPQDIRNIIERIESLNATIVTLEAKLRQRKKIS